MAGNRENLRTGWEIGEAGLAVGGEDSVDISSDQIAKNRGLRRYLPWKCLCNQDGALGSDNPWAALKEVCAGQK